MVICLTKQLKTLESYLYNVERDNSFTFDEMLKIIELNNNEKDELDSTNAHHFKREYLNSTFEKNIKIFNYNYNYEKEYEYIEKAIAHIKRNKKQYQMLVFILATTINFSVFGAGVCLALEKGTVGYKLYQKGKEICKIVCIIGFMVESGKALLTGTLDGLFKIIVSYSAFLLAIRFLPEVVEWFLVG